MNKKPFCTGAKPLSLFRHTRCFFLIPMLVSLALSGCAISPKGPRPLTVDESVDKIVNDLNMLSQAIETYKEKTLQPPKTGGAIEFGGFLLSARVIDSYPKPPVEVQQPGQPNNRYQYEYFARFDELGGPTAEGDDSALWLPGITQEACLGLNSKHTSLGARIPVYRQEGYVQNEPIYCIDFGGVVPYSVMKIHQLR